MNDETLYSGDRITKPLHKRGLSFTITFFESYVLLLFHVECRDGEDEPDGPKVDISLSELERWAEFRPDRHRRIDLQQVCVGCNVAFECSVNDQGFCIEWKDVVVRIEYSNVKSIEGSQAGG